MGFHATLPFGGANLLAADYEQKIIDFARRTFDDITECRGADYSVKWVDMQLGTPVPMLVIAFTLPGISHQPALAVGLVTVRKDSLLDTMPGKALYEGDRLRSHLLRSAEDYLARHGVRIFINADREILTP